MYNILNWAFEVHPLNKEYCLTKILNWSIDVVIILLSELRDL